MKNDTTNLQSAIELIDQSIKALKDVNSDSTELYIYTSGSIFRLYSVKKRLEDLQKHIAKPEIYQANGIM